METEKFIKTVMEMRQAQKDYFYHKSKGAHQQVVRDFLIKSKEIEKKVDDHLKVYNLTGRFE